MRVLTLPEFVPTVPDDLSFMLGRPTFSQDMLSCLPIPYAKYYRSPEDSRNAQSSGGRHHEILLQVRELLRSNYKATVTQYEGQLRIVVQGPLSNYYAFALRKAHAVPGGFATSKYGRALENLSLIHLADDEFEFVPGAPNLKGVLLAFDESKERQNYLEMWLAYEWSAQRGSEFIDCESCAYLGGVYFDVNMRQDNGGDDQTGGTVVVQ